MGNVETNPLVSYYLVQLGEYTCPKYFLQKTNGQYYSHKSTKLILSISSEIEKIISLKMLCILLVLY